MGSRCYSEAGHTVSDHEVLSTGKQSQEKKTELCLRAVVLVTCLILNFHHSFCVVRTSVQPEFNLSNNVKLASTINLNFYTGILKSFSNTVLPFFQEGNV